ncbi:hypothetical protein AMELA_G00057580, partial [Ameiurus melas]
MSSGSLLLVLLVLGYLQSFTEAQSNGSAVTPGGCCFNFQMHRIPLRFIKEYKQTRVNCTNDGIVFILNNGS